MARMAAPGSGSALPGSVDVVEEWSTLVSGDADAAADNAGSPSALLMLRSVSLASPYSITPTGKRSPLWITRLSRSTTTST